MEFEEDCLNGAGFVRFGGSTFKPEVRKCAVVVVNFDDFGKNVETDQRGI